MMLQSNAKDLRAFSMQNMPQFGQNNTLEQPNNTVSPAKSTPDLYTANYDAASVPAPTPESTGTGKQLECFEQGKSQNRYGTGNYSHLSPPEPTQYSINPYGPQFNQTSGMMTSPPNMAYQMMWPPQYGGQLYQQPPLGAPQSDQQRISPNYPFQLNLPENNLAGISMSEPGRQFFAQPLDPVELTASSYPAQARELHNYQPSVYDIQNSNHFSNTHNKVTKSHNAVPDNRRRTKTGCLTCRRRRVKCDERHPHCRNCQRSERICLGYDVIFNSFRLTKLKEAALERRIMIASRFPKDAETNPDVIAESIRNAPPEFVINTWEDIVDTFSENFAVDLDLLLDCEFISKIASRCKQYLKTSPDRIVTVAGEIEVMLRLFELTSPTSEIGISVIESNIPLEKMRTSIDYYVIRTIVTGIIIGPESVDFIDKISSSLSRATELVKCLDGVNQRALLVSNILYNTCSPRDRSRISTNAVLELINAEKSKRLNTTFSRLFWEILQIIANGSILEDTFMDLSPLTLFASSDIRGILLLLALHTAGSHSALPILQSISPKGLSLTILEIGLMTR